MLDLGFAGSMLQALIREGKCGAIRILDVPYSKFVEKYPFLVTGNPSKSRKSRRFYPSEVGRSETSRKTPFVVVPPLDCVHLFWTQIVEGRVYLGDWASATEVKS